MGDSRPYFTMKLVEGRDLASLLGERRSATEDWPRLLGIFEQICQTMAYAHSRGVIHCDLKPSNVMVGSFGEVQVMDWGLARVLERGTGGDDVETRAGGAGPVESIRGDARQDEQGSRAGSVLGTPAYMAPEQARGENSRLDERTDVFGLGAVLCEILTGEPPFVGRDLAELQRLAVDADLAGARARLDQSGAEPELIALARRCLAPLPRDRPRDAGAVASAITGHHRGVQEKLRQAELARVEAQAKAADEKMRLRLAVGLAAAIVVLVLTVGFGGARLAWDRQRRSARLELAVRDVELLKLQAELAGDDPAKWAAARDAAQRAFELRDDARDDATRSRVAELAAEIRKKADENEADIRLLERLAGIREFSDGAAFWQTVGDYAAAFRSAGLDLQRQPPEEVGRSIARRPARVALALATAIDDWAALRYEHGGRELAARLIAAARVADPDPWRGRLRSALLEPRESRLDGPPGLCPVGPPARAAARDPRPARQGPERCRRPRHRRVRSAARPATPSRRPRAHDPPGRDPHDAVATAGGHPVLHDGPGRPTGGGAPAVPCADRAGRDGRGDRRVLRAGPRQAVERRVPELSRRVVASAGFARPGQRALRGGRRHLPRGRPAPPGGSAVPRDPGDRAVRAGPHRRGDRRIPPCPPARAGRDGGPLVPPCPPARARDGDPLLLGRDPGPRRAGGRRHRRIPRGDPPPARLGPRLEQPGGPAL